MHLFTTNLNCYFFIEQVFCFKHKSYAYTEYIPSKEAFSKTLLYIRYIMKNIYSTNF